MKTVLAGQRRRAKPPPTAEQAGQGLSLLGTRTIMRMREFQPRGELPGELVQAIRSSRQLITARRRAYRESADRLAAATG